MYICKLNNIAHMDFIVIYNNILKYKHLTLLLFSSNLQINIKLKIYTNIYLLNSLYILLCLFAIILRSIILS